MEKEPQEQNASAAGSNMDLESGREGISHFQMIWDQGVVTKEIINYDYEGEGTEEDPYVVEWIENDPRNPMTWPKMKKWIIAIAVANSVLVVSFCSSAFSGGKLFPQPRQLNPN
jgi:hypothetical protein